MQLFEGKGAFWGDSMVKEPKYISWGVIANQSLNGVRYHETRTLGRLLFRPL